MTDTAPQNAPPNDAKAAPAKADPKALAWTNTTYFAEGLPYAIVINVAAQFFTAFGASLKEIGLASLFHLPWNLKAFVGPFVDQYGTKRLWLLGVELLVVLALFALAFTTTLPNVIVAASIAFLVLAVFSATHDIAIDGFYLEALDQKQQDLLVGWRAPAYRAALLFAGGPMIVLAGAKGWTLGMLAFAGVMAALWVFHLVILPRNETYKRPFVDLLKQVASLRFLIIGASLALLIAGGRAFLRSDVWASFKAWGSATFPALSERLATRGPADWIGLGLLIALVVGLVFLRPILARVSRSKSNYAKSFVGFLEQPWAGRMLVYIVLFRIGESFLQQMKVPFFQRHLGMSQAEYGVVNGTIGMLVGIAAPVLGGILIGKLGFKRCIWPFLIAQNGLHLVFCVVAIYADEIRAMKTLIVPGMAQPGVGLALLTGAIVIEIIGAGLGTAAFMVYIIRCCRPDHKAAHMALLTSLMSISFTLAGVFSGFLAEAMGFTAFFAFTFFVTLPGMAMTLWVPNIDERGAPPRLGRTAS